MRCERATKQLVGYTLDELTERERKEAQAHLAECADCRALLHAQERTLATLSKAPSPEPTPAMQQELLRVLRQRQAEITEARRRQRERGEAVLFGLAATLMSSAIAFAGLTNVRALLPCLAVLMLLGALSGGLMLAVLAARPRNFGGER